HLGAQWQFAFADPVAAVAALADRGEMVGRFARPAIAEGAFVHLAAAAEIAGLRVLWRAERTGVETVAAADAQILRMEHHAVGRLVEAIDRTHRHAGRVRAMHAGDRDRALAGLAVIECHHPAAIDPPRHLVLVLAGGDAGVALDAAFGVAQELHPRHGCAPHAFSM